MLTVEDDGTVKIAATSADDAEKASGLIRELTRVPEIENLHGCRQAHDRFWSLCGDFPEPTVYSHQPLGSRARRAGDRCGE